MKDILKNKGQVLIEYLLLIFIISINIFIIFGLFSKYIKLVYQNEVIKLGYENISNEKLNKLQRDILLKQIELENFRKDIKNYKTEFRIGNEH